jgi:iron complex transport system ATP-binding protein
LKDGRVEETGMDAIFQDAATLERVYGVDLHVFHHPSVNKRQIAFVPPYQYPETDFHELYQLQKEPGKLCLSFVRPLRTLSLGSNETGLDWCQEIVQQQRLLVAGCADTWTKRKRSKYCSTNKCAAFGRELTSCCDEGN